MQVRSQATQWVLYLIEGEGRKEPSIRLARARLMNMQGEGGGGDEGIAINRVWKIMQSLPGVKETKTRKEKERNKLKIAGLMHS